MFCIASHAAVVQAAAAAPRNIHRKGVGGPRVKCAPLGVDGVAEAARLSRLLRATLSNTPTSSGKAMLLEV